MPQFPRFQYSNKDVQRAGEALAGDLYWTDETAEHIRRVFSVANNYRDSHALPMRKVRFELSGLLQRERIKGVTVARLKRMPSIRRKLRKIKSNLNQIQDLAGVRSIAPSMADVDRLIQSVRTNTGHEVFREYPYITQPKPDGYRCHHMVLKFRGVDEDEAYNDRRIEIQIRTRLQHAWATAVESVGLFRREDLKAGVGNADWLQLFRLMSLEFQLSEGCAEPDAGRADRLSEIASLNRSLRAAALLEDLRQAVRTTERYKFDPKNKPDYFLIRYDRTYNTVSVRAQYGAIDAVRLYDLAENIDSRSSTGNGFTTVLVEVDEVENLRSAYPNYFGDVDLFKSKLQELVGADGPDFTLDPQPRAPVQPRPKPDYSWLHSYRRWK